ncbi:MAG TPA: hypothetical protein VNH18_08130 [Bryobacteraceae bacterium]|nr:hypothetical protein [Bryobacteraceae bacterium]
MSSDANTSALDTHLREIARYESGEPMDPMEGCHDEMLDRQDTVNDRENVADGEGAGLVAALRREATTTGEEYGEGHKKDAYNHAARLAAPYEARLIAAEARVAEMEARPAGSLVEELRARMDGPYPTAYDREYCRAGLLLAVEIAARHEQQWQTERARLEHSIEVRRRERDQAYKLWQKDQDRADRAEQALKDLLAATAALVKD